MNKLLFIRLKRNIRENILLIISFSLIIGLFSTSSFFNNSAQLEDSLLNQIPIDFQLYNTHVFSHHYSEADPLQNEWNAKKKLLGEIIDYFNSFSKSDEISNKNYNILLSISGCVSSYGEQDFYNNEILSLGVNDTAFQENKYLELISGRFFSDIELIEGAPKIIVSETTRKGYTGGQIKVGDVIPISIYEVKEELMPTAVQNYWSVYQPITTVDCEVIGIYRNHYRYDFNDGLEDAFLNRDMVLAPNNLLLHMLNDTEFSPTLYDQSGRVIHSPTGGLTMEINNISFSIDDYRNIIHVQEQFDLMIKKLDEVVKEEYGYETFGSKQVNHDYLYLMEAISGTRRMYNIIFIILTAIALIVFGLIVNYLIQTKIKEINTLYSLGMTYNRIIMHYVIYYMILAFAAIIIGTVIGYIISQTLIKGIISDNIQLKNRLISFALSGRNSIETAEHLNIVMDNKSFTKSICYTVAGGYIIILILIPLTLLCHRKMLKKHGIIDNA